MPGTAGQIAQKERQATDIIKKAKQTDVRPAGLIRPLRLGALELPNNILLAPLAGVTDLPFRLLCREQGAGFAYTEMISAKGVSYGSAGSVELAKTVPGEGPVGVQLFGSEPEIMAEAAVKFVAGGAPLIDINMGCPMRKITGNGEGSALMRDPGLIERIVAAIVRAVAVPVTVKLRRGFEMGEETCVECARAAEAGGCAAVAVHGRYREQYYSGTSDWGAVARVKAAVRVPVLLSGDVTSRETALEALASTNADGVLIGRASMGNPWIFRVVLGTGAGPDLEERAATIRRHLELMRLYKGDVTAASEFRKHVIWYLKGLRGSAEVRERVCRAADADEAAAIINAYFERLANNCPESGPGGNG